jgi:hypothetical protein
MKYIKNLINNILYLLKCDIKLVNNIKTTNMKNDIKNNYKYILNNENKVNVCCERLGIIEHDLNHDEGINKRIDKINCEYVPRKVFLSDINGINNKIDELEKNMINNKIDNMKVKDYDNKTIQTTNHNKDMSNQRVTNMEVK